MSPSAMITDELAKAAARLAKAGIESARLDAEVLLRYVLGIDRTALFQRMREPLPPDRLDQFTALVERRVAHVPVAYLTGQKEFMGLSFAVAPPVLIPRPETELLVEWALAWLGTAPYPPNPPHLPPPEGGTFPRIRGKGGLFVPSPELGGGSARRAGEGAIVIDVGTGSGAIALSLATHLPLTWRGGIVGADVSPAALRIAAHNRHQLGLDDAVALVRGDLLSWCGMADLVLANLPYLRPEQVAANPELAAEPDLALLGGADGLALIRRLVADVARVLRPGGAVALEIDPSQAAAAADLIRAALPGADVAVHPDLAGLARLVTATR